MALQLESLNPVIDLPAFSGPFDLLLHLIEREALDITAISLSVVTEQYLLQVRQLKENHVEQLIDFLVIAARLVLIKSRALLPRPPIEQPGEEEEDPAASLVRQLQRYRQYKNAAAWLADRQERGLRTHLRVAPPVRPQVSARLDLSGIGVQDFAIAMEGLLARSETREESVSVVRPPSVTIEGQLLLLRGRLSRQGSIQFRELLNEQPGREEVAVTLLATLELIKRRELIARQDERFGPIELFATTPTIPEMSPDS
jgi:segregation and condensation protein A